MNYSLNGFTVYASGSVSDPSFYSKWNTISNDEEENRYYKFLEKVSPADIKFLYYVICKNVNGEEIPCARLYIQLVNFNHKNITLNNRFLSAIVRFFFRTHPFKLYIFGNAFAVNFSPVKFDASLIDANILANLMCDISKLTSHDVLILKDIPSHFDPAFFNRSRLEPYTADLTMTMHIRKKWKTFEDYYKDLTKKYRKRADKILSAGKELQRRIITLNEYDQFSKRINALLNQVSSKQMVRIGIVNENYIRTYLEQFPETFSIHGFFAGDELIAFYTSIDRNEMLEIHYIGIDYRYNEQYQLYFNMLFESLNQAILSGKSQLELGRTAREAKASLGSTAEYFNDYIRLNNPLARFLSKRLTGIFQSEMGQKWMDRRPLKPE